MHARRRQSSNVLVGPFLTKIGGGRAVGNWVGF
jgi:hypothetical protein